MREFIMNNFVWLFSIAYFLGSILYYKLIVSVVYEKHFSEIGFPEIYNDSIYILLWFPEIILMFIRLIITLILFLPIKLFGIWDKKKKE